LTVAVSGALSLRENTQRFFGPLSTSPFGDPRRPKGSTLAGPLAADRGSPYGFGMSAITPAGLSAVRRPFVRLSVMLLAAALAWLVTASLAPVPATVLIALLLAGGASQAGGLHLSRHRYWGLIGLAAGGLLGTASSLAERAQQLPIASHGTSRLLALLLLALAGVIGGLCLGRDAESGDRRHPRDLLRAASALTTGLFAFLVTLTYGHQGLEAARAFSSRLSTTLTIVVTAVVLPGWISQQLRRRNGGSHLLEGRRR
jgi:hypothetical protein